MFAKKHKFQKGSPKIGTGCLMLFSLPFAGVGVVMVGLIVMTLVDYARMGDWVEVPCKIQKVELEEHHDEDGTTYKVVASYAYVYQDRNYTGDRVAIHGGGDNVGSFQQQKYRELKRYQQNGQPFRCFVDPSDPSDAILYRQLRWEMLGFYSFFALGFGGVGFGILGGSLWATRKARAEVRLIRQHPAEPWRWKEAWADGEIRSSNKVRLVVALLFATFWNLVSAPVLFFVPGEVLDNGNKLALLGLLFPLVGVGLIAWALYEVLRWRKYGPSVFRMASVPGVIGGSLAGVVQTSAKVFPAEGYRVKLSCICKTTSGEDTTEETLWDDEQLIERELQGTDFQRSAIPVMFAVPYDLPASTTDDGNRQITWRLEVSAATPGIDYRATFDVPVFKTEESQPDFKLDDSLIEQYAAPRDAGQEFAATGITRLPAPGGQGDRFIFPMGRHPGVIFSLGLFLTVWSGAIVLMWCWSAPLIFPVVFGLFDLILVIAVLDLVFYQSTVDISPHSLIIRGGPFGIGRTRIVAADQIKEIQTPQGMQSGTSVFFNIVAATTDGRKVTLGKRLRGRRAAECVVDELKKSLGRVDKAEGGERKAERG